eukprot:6206111-Pleurochrysis_carterae.AAC.2
MPQYMGEGHQPRCSWSWSLQASAVSHRFQSSLQLARFTLRGKWNAASSSLGCAIEDGLGIWFDIEPDDVGRVLRPKSSERARHGGLLADAAGKAQHGMTQRRG